MLSTSLLKSSRKISNEMTSKRISFILNDVLCANISMMLSLEDAFALKNTCTTINQEMSSYLLMHKSFEIDVLDVALHLRQAQKIQIFEVYLGIEGEPVNVMELTKTRTNVNLYGEMGGHGTIRWVHDGTLMLDLFLDWHECFAICHLHAHLRSSTLRS